MTHIMGACVGCDRICTTSNSMIVQKIQFFGLECTDLTSQMFGIVNLWQKKKNTLYNVLISVCRHDSDAESSIEEVVAPKSLNSDISYFGVGGKQAIFFIGTATRVYTFRIFFNIVNTFNLKC